MGIDSGSWWRKRAGLEGRVAIVSGGAGGLGEAITRDLMANGVRVALIDVDEKAVDAISRALKESESDLESDLESESDFIAKVGDARDAQQMEDLFGEAEKRWGRIDILVNVVGGTFKAPFSEQSPRAWDALIRANFVHVLQSTQLAMAAMRRGGRGGSIVNITTIEAHRAAPNFAVYSAAKAAVAHFSRSLALEVARDGIRVNCVAPDITPTPNMIAISGGDSPGNHLTDELTIGIGIPMGRVGVPSDIAGSVVFLASDLSSYMTGITLHPDGGTFASSGWFNWPGDGYSNMPPPSVVSSLRS